MVLVNPHFQTPRFAIKNVLVSNTCLGVCQQVIVTTGADGQQTTSINGKSYVVVTTDGENGEKQTVLVAADEAHEHTGTGWYITTSC